MQERPVVIYHLGFQKTGTTSIQRFLRANAATLSGANILLLPKGDGTLFLRVPLVHLFENGSSHRLEGLHKDIRESTEKLRSSGKNVCLISEENILGNNVYNDNGHIFDFAKRAVKIIEDATQGVDLRFVFYIRDFQSWMNSVYQQGIKTRRYTMSFSVWANRAPFKTEWEPHMAAIRESTSSPVRFVQMEDEIAEGFLGKALLDEAGISKEIIARCTVPGHSNESLPPSAVEFLRAANRSKLDLDALNIVRKIVMRQKGMFR